MKRIIPFTLIIGLSTLTVFTAIAQTTNVMQRANFVLKGTMQATSGVGVTTVRLNNKDLLAALNATGQYQFGPRATFLFVSTDDEPPAVMVQVRVGRQVTNTDIGDYFGVTEIGNEVHSQKDDKRWETWNIAFNNGTSNETAFILWGATEIHRGAIHARGVKPVIGSQRVESDVRGVGRIEDTITIFSGRVSGVNATSSVTE